MSRLEVLSALKKGICGYVSKWSQDIIPDRAMRPTNVASDYRTTHTNRIMMPNPQQRMTFTELPNRTLHEFINQISVGRLYFLIRCLNFLKMQAVGPKVGSVTSTDGGFVAHYTEFDDISVSRAKDYGLILPKNIDSLAAARPNLKIRPLVFACHGIGSGKMGTQIKEAALNLVHQLPAAITDGNALISSIVEDKRQTCDADVVIVPIIAGHSLGGMYGKFIAVNNGWSSVTVNGLGLGSAACELIGQAKWETANNRHASHHISFSVDGDFTSSDLALFSLRKIFEGKIPGLTVTIPLNQTTAISHPVKTHTEYLATMIDCLEALQEKLLKSEQA